jgi:dsRNA-specific ribonuclease/superfamily II DNA or RNA helicase
MADFIVYVYCYVLRHNVIPCPSATVDLALFSSETTLFFPSMKSQNFKATMKGYQRNDSVMPSSDASSSHNARSLSSSLARFPSKSHGSMDQAKRTGVVDQGSKNQLFLLGGTTTASRSASERQSSRSSVNSVARAKREIVAGEFDDFDSDEEGGGEYFDADKSSRSSRLPRGSTAIDGGNVLYDRDDSPSLAGSVLTEDSDSCLSSSNAITNDEARGYSKFFLSKPVSQEEVDATSDAIYANMDQILAQLEEGGVAAFDRIVLEQQSSKQHNKIQGSEASIDQKNQRQEALETATIRGSPRDYQAALFEIVKTRNSIVHLGTGKGKTLIALLCITHFLENGATEGLAPNKRKKALFLVPSVALALQQTTTLRANLPYTVETACWNCAKVDRVALSEADVLVATHGSMHDLLMHYGDMFTIEHYALVVVDECHYAHGNHQYKLDKWYHTIQDVKARPRILGLTASPVINVKSNHTDEHLSRLLQTLEETLNAQLVTLMTSGHETLTPTKEPAPALGQERGDFLHQKARERQVYYNGDPEASDYPEHDTLNLHPHRTREMNQLFILYQDLGPLVVAMYCRSLVKEVSCNVYEKESAAQFQCLRRHLSSIIWYCEQKTRKCPQEGRTDKLAKLEDCLLGQIDGNEEAVGLVFVQRRMTAMALYAYFSRAKGGGHSSGNRPSTAISVLPPPPSKEESATNLLAEVGRKTPNVESTFLATSQFGDADEDHFCRQVNVVAESRGDHSVDDDDTYFTATSFFSKHTQMSSITAITFLSDLADSSNPQNTTPARTLPSQFEDSDLDEATGYFELTSRLHNENRHDAYFDTDKGTSSSIATSVAQELAQENLVPIEEQFSDPNEGPNPLHFSWFDDSLQETKHVIRCGVLIRQASQMFKHRNASNHIKLDDEQGNGSDQEWLHQEMKVHETMNALRKKEINVLFATSVVEEGIDVQTCSFVVVFDSASCTKAYIQMKGRARQKGAVFFLFQNANEWKDPDLPRLQQAEIRVHSLIETRKDISLFGISLAEPLVRLLQPEADLYHSEELHAIEEQRYQSLHGEVDLKSAKTLLNRYVLNIPIEATARTTKDAYRLHMPLFEEYRLVLPAHLPVDMRVVSLPDQYHSFPVGERQQFMAMMACVRLHKLKLLNERLLPLGKEDLTSEILGVAAKQGEQKTVHGSSICSLFASNQREVFLYPIIQQGGTSFSETRNALKWDSRSLALVSCERLAIQVDCTNYRHHQLGNIYCELGDERVVVLDEFQWSICASFFSHIFGARWQRKSKGEWFRSRSRTQRQEVLAPYIMGLLTSEGRLDWEMMERLIVDCSRQSYKREKASRSYSTTFRMSAPKLCNPTHHPNATYIIMGPTQIDCSAQFPGENEGVSTFQDYYRVKYECEVPANDRLFLAHRLWYQPSHCRNEPRDEADWHTASGEKDIFATRNSNGIQRCPHLATVLLPHSILREAKFADPSLLLLSILLPQLLYAVERTLTIQSFVRHCNLNFPFLGKCLGECVPVRGTPESLLFTVMTAKSTNLTSNYDRFEWFGDAVLKLLQSDTLLHNPRLRCCVQHLHEGDLTTLRSAIVTNQYLADACRRIGFDKFVLTTKLARGEWVPCNLELYYRDDEDRIVTGSDNQPSTKVSSDFIESLLGLVHIRFGYEAAKSVGLECGVLLAQGASASGSSHSITGDPRHQLYSSAQNMTGRSFHNPGLIEEAFTHPSAVHEEVPSYQRLEWMGDAVLSIAIREWIILTYPDMLLGDMATLEAAIVSNEVLGFQCFKSGLHKFIKHRDHSLPARLEQYAWTIEELGRGIWGSEPPKILADVVEALLGAAHVDGGYKAGMLAVKTMMDPILRTVESLGGDATQLYHPITKMNHLAGNLLHVRVQREDSFLRESGRKTMVWQGSRWRETTGEGSESTGTVRAVGKNIITVAEPTRKSARNRACALTVATLEKHPKLAERWKVVTTAIDRHSAKKLLQEERTKSMAKRGRALSTENIQWVGLHTVIDGGSTEHWRDGLG